MNEYILNGSYNSHMWGKMLYVWFASRQAPRWQMYEYEQMASVSRFIDQVKWANSIFFDGGETLALVKQLRELGDWTQYLKDKTIVAVSAGISALMTVSFNTDHFIEVDGLGLLPFASVVHYRDNMQWMVRFLKTRHPDLPVITVPDRTYTVIHH